MEIYRKRPENQRCHCALARRRQLPYCSLGDYGLLPTESSLVYITQSLVSAASVPYLAPLPLPSLCSGVLPGETIEGLDIPLIRKHRSRRHNDVLELLEDLAIVDSGEVHAWVGLVVLEDLLLYQYGPPS